MIAPFWRAHPALEAGVALALGVAVALGHWWLLFWLLFFRRWQPVVLFFAAFVWINSCYTFPLAGKSEGIATLEIHQESRVRSHFGTLWVQRATLKKLTGHTVKNLPVTLRYPEHASRPDPAYRWEVSGTLSVYEPHWGSFKPDRHALWRPVGELASWVEGRRRSKEEVLFWIKGQIPSEKVASFLAGLLTGDLEDPLTKTLLGRVGLHHIMAVSGMHFTLIAGFLTLLCRPLGSLRLTSLFMLTLLTGYLWFVGPAPSVMRAWVMVALFWVGCLIGRQTTPMNSLGVALLVVLLHDPLQVERVGFLFSFLICATLILGMPVGKWLMRFVFPRRTLKELFALSFWQMHLVILVGWIRKALKLSLVVHAAAFPLMIALFGQFPLIGLLVNLFFPPMVSLSMLLLGVGALLFWAPPLSHCVHTFNSAYTSFLLDLTNRIPPSWHTVIYVDSPHPIVISLYITFLFTLLIKMKLYVNIKQTKQGEERWQTRNYQPLKAAM